MGHVSKVHARNRPAFQRALVRRQRARTRRALMRLLFVTPLLAGCGIELATPGDFAAGGDAPIRTDRESYTLRQDGVGLATEVAITFENRSGRTMYIVNCNDLLAPVLEKRVGQTWVPYWSPVLPQCLSEPIVIRPGATLDRELYIWGAPPNINWGPEWASTDIEGTYRMVLHSVVYDYDAGSYPFGEDVPVEHRVSNTFTLRR